MAARPINGVVQNLCQTVRRRDEPRLTDGQLLGCFIEARDDAAFQALVRRHGPMVFGVCQRMLGHQQDAEDAFQASFLVLVRKAAGIMPRELVGNWLYGVAYQTAFKARIVAGKRRMKERQVVEMPEPEAAQQSLWRELQPLLDQELSRLPDKYRIPIVLCDLQGKSGREAARQVGCPEGTLTGRLARARRMLAERLARSGFALSSMALTAALSLQASASVPAKLLSATVQAARLFGIGQAVVPGVISPKVAALTEGVLKAMLLAKLKIGFAVLLVATALGIGLLKQSAQAHRRPGVLGNAEVAENTPMVGDGRPSFAHHSAKLDPEPAKDDPELQKALRWWYSLKEVDGSAVLAMDDITIVFDGIACSGKSWGLLQVAGPGSGMGLGDGLRHTYEDGVAILSFAGQTLKVTEGGTKLVYGKQVFDLRGGKKTIKVKIRGVAEFVRPDNRDE